MIKITVTVDPKAKQKITEFVMVFVNWYDEMVDDGTKTYTWYHRDGKTQKFKRSEIKFYDLARTTWSPK